MGEKWRQLRYEDRLRIDAWLQTDMKVKDIAERLGVSRQTIYREIKRGQFTKRNSDWTETTVYDPYVAERSFQENLRVRGAELKIGNDRKLLEFIEDLIVRKKYSPQAALVTARKAGKTTNTEIKSVNTIYSYIRKGVFLNLSMSDLPVRQKSHRKKKVTIQKRIQAGDSINERPAHIDTREEFGHWEMDTVVGKLKGQGKSLLVLTERKTREEVLVLMKRHTSECVVHALDGLERKYGEKNFRNIFKTITVDNGPEFSDVRGMERSRRNQKKRTKLYYCHPYSSWERGSNENNNKLIRRHIPKGQSMDMLNRNEIQWIEDWMNHYPRSLLEDEPSIALFKKELETATA